MALYVALLALLCAAESRSQQTTSPTLVEVSGTRLPGAPLPGLRLDTTVSGGWDSNPLNVPEGPSDYAYVLGLDASYGRTGRRSAAGITAYGRYRGYRQLQDARTLAGSASVAARHRPSRRVTAAVSSSVSYDNSTSLEILNQSALQLPQARTLILNFEAGFRFDVDRRTRWSSSITYYRLTFDAGPLVDTSSFRADSAFTRRFTGVGDISIGYQFLSTGALATTVVNDARAPSHSGAIGWGRLLPLDLSVGLLGGATFVPTIGVAGPDSGQWLFLGGASVSRKVKGSVVGLSYRRSTSPGYGFGQLLYSDLFNASFAVPLTSRFVFTASGTSDHSKDVFIPTVRLASEYANLQLSARIRRDTTMTLFYQYRRYAYWNKPSAQSQSAGLSLGHVLQPGRSRADEGR